MTDTLEELTADILSKDHVERRVADWEGRIESLYEQIIAWLAPEWHRLEPVRYVRMFEPPMREVGLAPRALQSLDMRKEGTWSLAIVPRTLWIIGANGRLEMVRAETNVTTHFIVDLAGNFEPAKWHIVPTEDRATRLPLTKAALRSVV